METGREMIPLQEAFNDAARKGIRYVAMIEVGSQSVALAAHDAMDIVRYVREKSLRPGSPVSKVFWFFDTQQKDDFGRQLTKDLKESMPEAVYQAYQKYQLDRKTVPAHARPKGLFARMLGR